MKCQLKSCSCTSVTAIFCGTPTPVYLLLQKRVNKPRIYGRALSPNAFQVDRWTLATNTLKEKICFYYLYCCVLIHLWERKRRKTHERFVTWFSCWETLKSWHSCSILVRTLHKKEVGAKLVTLPSSTVQDLQRYNEFLMSSLTAETKTIPLHEWYFHKGHEQWCFRAPHWSQKVPLAVECTLALGRSEKN